MTAHQARRRDRPGPCPAGRLVDFQVRRPFPVARVNRANDSAFPRQSDGNMTAARRQIACAIAAPRTVASALPRTIAPALSTAFGRPASSTIAVRGEFDFACGRPSRGPALRIPPNFVIAPALPLEFVAVRPQQRDDVTIVVGHPSALFGRGEPVACARNDLDRGWSGPKLRIFFEQIEDHPRQLWRAAPRSRVGLGDKAAHGPASWRPKRRRPHPSRRAQQWGEPFACSLDDSAAPIAHS